MATTFEMHFAPRGALLESARDCEAEVFLRWFGNTREQLRDEYRDIEDHSVFLAVTDARQEVVGAVRLLPPGGPAGLKTLADVGRPPWSVPGARVAAAAGLDPASTWEVVTLGVRAGSGAGELNIALALYHGLMTIAQVNRMSAFVAILDERVRRLLGSVGITTRALPGTGAAPYLGSTSSTPVYANFAAMLASQRLQFPDAYRLVTLGIGLDNITVPARERFALDSPLALAPRP